MKKSLIKTLAAFSLMGFAIMANGQSVEQPAWSVSKDVQKVANKQLFEDESLKASHINAVVMSPTWNVSKGVHQIGKSSDVGKGNVVSTGVPDWVISKGVQRIQRKKADSQKKQEIFKREDEITRKGDQ